MPSPPTIVVTGASGFLGNRMLLRLRDTWRIVALDRIPRVDPGVAEHPNIHWHIVDLADAPAVRAVFADLKREGGATALIHLAAYYDFTGEEDPEYRRTNVEATRILLEESRGLGLRRFVFASSVAACLPSAPGRRIREITPPLGDHIYARTKRDGEEMMAAAAGSVPTCIVRFAALFSDWCEYPPLYFFLDTWLSKRWNARVLGGEGDSAVPYLHVRDAVAFLLRVLERMDDLEPAEVLLASPDDAVSHLQLFEAATASRFGRPRHPIFVPRSLCRPGMVARDALGRLRGQRQFERPWMAEYIDRRMDVDASRTRERMSCGPNPRLEILRRIPFMVDNARTDPVRWYGRNLEVLEHRHLPPSFHVHRLYEQSVVDIEGAFDRSLAAVSGFDRMPDDERRRVCRQMVRNLGLAVRTGAKAPFRLYCHDLAERLRARPEFGPGELERALRALEAVSCEEITCTPEGDGLRESVREHLSTTVDFGIDEVLEVYETPART